MFMIAVRKNHQQQSRIKLSMHAFLAATSAVIERCLMHRCDGVSFKTWFDFGANNSALMMLNYPSVLASNTRASLIAEVRLPVTAMLQIL